MVGPVHCPVCFYCLQFQAVKVPYPQDAYSAKIAQQEKEFVSVHSAGCVCVLEGVGMAALLHAS